MSIIIQEVKDNSLVLNVNGEIKVIKYGFSELKKQLETTNADSFQFAEKIYNIGEINEANFGFITEKKAFNEHLTKELIYAIQPFSQLTQRFLQNAEKDKTKNWEAINNISDTGKDVITISYVGTIGIQLRKLMAIGKENNEQKTRKYIAHCIETAKSALRLLSFTLVSKLWDEMKEKQCALHEEETKALKQLFEHTFDYNIQEEYSLLHHLYQLFTTNHLSFPLSEFTSLNPQLQEGSELQLSCVSLQEINELLDREKHKYLTCFDAEQALTSILKHLAFLANYRMVSIKQVTYEEVRNTPPRYLHSYTSLGIDKKRNMNAETLAYNGQTISTDAILLDKGRYQQSVNLFPFMIDMNALTFEGGTKVCFYSHRDFDDGSLNFRFIEDNQVHNIVYSHTHTTDCNLKEILADAEKRKNYKLDTVFLQFEDARKTLLGEGNTHTTGFEQLFNDEP